MSEFGVADFSWEEYQKEDSDTPPVPSTSRFPDPAFQNPALAAIQASQTTLANGSSTLASTEYPATSQSNVKQEPHSPPSIPLTPATIFSTPHVSNGLTVLPSLKRPISQVSDVEISSSHRQQLSYPYSAPVLDEFTPSPPPPPAKRRPDPNSNELTSDLDDSDEEFTGNGVNDGGEEDDMDFMFCLYDKVQRTKSKYKVALTHGVIGIQGREWVFNRANGDYDWIF